jgi:hypothetical protein
MVNEFVKFHNSLAFKFCCMVYNELVPKPGWFRNKLLEKPAKARFFL